ncbi:MAG: AAA family ATPase [Spirochaetales bacterium]|nr:AAA family ATPase [Spirochaetales bacterium]
MDQVTIAGLTIPVTGQAGWIPETRLKLTPTTERNLERILYPLLQFRNVLLVGDAGSGKNALIYYINQERRHPVYRYSFNEDTLPEDLIGAYRIDPVSHQFVWQDGLLARALRSGSTFVADEMNLAPPEVLKRFSSVFTDGCLELLEGDGSIIEAREGFSFVATQNPATGFEGRKSLPREIQKHFAAVYVDSYPPEELATIIRELYPLEDEEIAELVRINQAMEEALFARKLGVNDLERFHFNLRNLKRVAARVVSARQDPLSEVSDIYLSPFRSPADRTFIQELIGQKTPEKILIRPAVHEEAGRIVIGRAHLTVKKENLQTRVHQAVRSHPAVMARLELLESLARSVEMGENVLLESDADVEPEEFASFFAALAGKNLTTISLSRGMHTADILGGLKPVTREGESGQVTWVDGPLTRAVKMGDYILLRGLEAAGPELVEKLNMLTDDARALVLPPESGEQEVLLLSDDARIFAVKHFRLTKSSPSVSRAFRNRFSAFVVHPLVSVESLTDFACALLPVDRDVAQRMARFHLALREKAHRREIGGFSVEAYSFGLTNFRRWAEHLLAYAEQGLLALERGAGIAYIHEIADARERDQAMRLLKELLAGVDPAKIQEIEAKKKVLKQSTYKDRIDWNPEEHYREAHTGKARRKLTGDAIKKGIEIDTPETGGSTKEGPDAWYGSDTRGNKGQGEPGQGGGGWGYRTEEIYQEFLRKRRPLWPYSMGVSLQEFKALFDAGIEQAILDIDRLFDPEIQIRRRYLDQGSRLDVRRYLAYLNGKSDGRIFDRTTLSVEEDRLKGIQVLFAVNKGRRIFNFDYSVAVLVALMSLSRILSNHRIEFGVSGYSDLANSKKHIDLVWYKKPDAFFTQEMEKELWEGLCEGWHGDTVAEYQVIGELAQAFSKEARTRILIFVSDFRGARGRVSMARDITAADTRYLKEAVDAYSHQGIICVGAGIGPRAIPDAAFHESLFIGSENYASLPSLLAGRITELIHRYHVAGVA